MYRTVIFILCAIIIGLSSFIVFRLDGPKKTDASVINNSDTELSAVLSDIQKRLSVFEEKMAEETEMRIDLENLINDINSKNAGVSDLRQTIEKPVNKITDGLVKVVLGRENKKEEGSEREKEISQFINGGFSEDEAVWLVDKREKIYLDSLYSQWESRHRRYLEQSSTRKTAVEEIEDRLGPEGYERYLKSIGSSVSAVIGSVIEGAPGDLAGLKVDDEIISYNGERVYDFIDLEDASARGELGEPVTIELIRNGEKMQISMERGPIGAHPKMKGGVYYTSSLPSLPN